MTGLTQCLMTVVAWQASNVALGVGWVERSALPNKYKDVGSHNFDKYKDVGSHNFDKYKDVGSHNFDKYKDVGSHNFDPTYYRINNSNFLAIGHFQSFGKIYDFFTNLPIIKLCRIEMFYNPS
jgi:hypothetical protein